MQLLQFWDTKEFATSITNNFIGAIVSLTDMSIHGYNSMGFNTQSLTQDVLQGQFTITTESPIPIMSYSENFTWAKYGHHILFPGELTTTTAKCQLTVKCNPSLNSMHCETLIAFLQTDLEACASNVLDKSSDVKIETFLKKVFLPKKGIQSGYNFDKCLETNSCDIVKETYCNATSSTIVPLSTFSNLFHKRFKKKPYLESTLKILQRYYIAMEEYPNQYHLFSGDENLYCLRCSRCHQPVTFADYIDFTLMKAPMAMLRHWGLARHKDHYPHCPLMFTSQSVYCAASDVFDIEKDKDSQANKFLAPCNGKTNDGMISFCKATEVDLDASYNSGNDGSDISSPNDPIVLSTLLLICVLFESFSDLDMAIDKGFLVPIQDIPLKDARTMIMVPKTKCREKEGNKTFSLKPKYYTSKDLSPRHIDEL